MVWVSTSLDRRKGEWSRDGRRATSSTSSEPSDLLDHRESGGRDQSWEDGGTMLATYDDLLGRVRLMAADLDRPPVVGISGHGGAGKSTLARRLGADVGLSSGQVVTMDRLYAPHTGARGLLDLHDWPTLLGLLAAVRYERPARLTYSKRLYDGSEGLHDVAMPPVVAVEGIRLLHDATTPLLDLAVWIDLDPETAGARAVARNREQGDDDAELDLWRTRWIPEGWDYERRYRPHQRADLVVAAALDD